MIKFLYSLIALSTLLLTISCSKNVDDFYIDLTQSQNKDYVHSLLNDSNESQLIDYNSDKQTLVSYKGVSLIFEPNSITNENGTPFDGKIKLKFNDMLDDAVDALISPTLQIENQVNRASNLINIQLSGQSGQSLVLSKKLKILLNVDKSENNLWTTFEFKKGSSSVFVKDQVPVSIQINQNESLMEVNGLLIETNEVSSTVGCSHQASNIINQQTVISANFEKYDSRIKNMLVLYRSNDGKMVIPLEHKSEGLFKSNDILISPNAEGHIIALKHSGEDHNGEDTYDLGLIKLDLNASFNHVELNVSPMALEEIKAQFKSL